MAVITAVPFAFAVTNPLVLTDAIFELLLDHVIPVFTFELVGLYVTDNCVVFVPVKSNVSVVLFKLILIGLVCTVIILDADFPFLVVTVIVALPFETPVTTPLEFTVATFSLLLDQSNPFSAFVVLGFIFELNCNVLDTPKSITAFVLSNSILTGVVFTVTVQDAVFPFPVFTVIVADPFAIAVTNPYLSTVATAELVLDHVIPVFILAEV